MVADWDSGGHGWYRPGLDIKDHLSFLYQTAMDELAGKRVVILGLARQGKALARFAAQVGAEVIVSDLRTNEQLHPALEELKDLPIEMVLGEHPESLLEGADLLAISGGVSTDLPIVKQARRRGIPLTNDSLEFMKRTPATVIGVTGSAGKTTTTALTGSMVETSGRRTWVGGNIGRPLITQLDKMNQEDVVVQELSSFQLELWTESPPIAAVLNITPNHLDRHTTMAAYSKAKSNILRFQSVEDVAVLSADDPGAMALQDVVRGRLRKFSLELVVEDGAFVRQGRVWMADGGKVWGLCKLDEIPLRGWHNVLNVLAAAILADSMGVSFEAIRQAIKSFTAVEHRLELVRKIGGVQYVNDSIATAPERALAALDSFTEPIILLAGGRDKDMVWGEWANRVMQRVKAVVLFGELAGFLQTLLEDHEAMGAGRPIITRVDTLDEAVNIAWEIAQEGDVVLLAPGGTSFDGYVDFAERGEAFRRSVHGLPVPATA